MDSSENQNRQSQYVILYNSRSLHASPSKQKVSMIIKLIRTEDGTIELREATSDDIPLEFPLDHHISDKDSESYRSASRATSTMRDSLQDTVVKKIKKPVPPRYYYNSVLHDYTGIELTEEQEMDIAIRSAQMFNSRLLHKRVDTAAIISDLSKKKLMERFSIDNMGTLQNVKRIPVKLQMPNGQELFDINDCIVPQKTEISRFIEANIINEHNGNYQPGYHGIGTSSGALRGGIRKRRRRRRHNYY